MDGILEIKNLHVSIDSKQILKGVNLVVKKGETHTIMGPNGSGKSTLANTLMGHPKYVIDHGDILPKWKYRGFVSTKPTLPSTQIPPFLMKLLGFIGAGFLTGFIIYALQPR